jgi:hypothetical protein
VKGESTPLRAWESRPGTAPPTPRRCATLCGMVSNHPVALYHPLPYDRRTIPSKKGRRNPRREDTRLLLARTRRHRDVRPVRAVTSIAIRPVRPSPSPRRHPGHYITIPNAVEACGDRTLPRQPLCLVRPYVNNTLESSRRRPSNRQPLRRCPRSCSWRRTGRAMTPHQKRDSPGRPSTPWHCTPCLHT